MTNDAISKLSRRVIGERLCMICAPLLLADRLSKQSSVELPPESIPRRTTTGTRRFVSWYLQLLQPTRVVQQGSQVSLLVLHLPCAVPASAYFLFWEAVHSSANLVL